MKKILFLFVLIATSLQLSAQVSEVVWGYCDDLIGSGIGSGNNKFISCAIRIPAEVTSLYQGKKITTIEVGLANTVSGLAPVINKGGMSNLIHQKAKLGKTGWNSLPLETPYVIGTGDLYVGYECIGTYAAATSHTLSPEGNYIQGDNGWDNYGVMGWGAFCIRLHIEGEEMPMDASIATSQAIECGTGNEVTLNTTLGNLSPEVISSLTLTSYLDNKKIQDHDIKLNLAKGRYQQVSIPVTVPQNPGIYQYRIEVKAINGKPDQYAGNNNATIPVTIMGKTYARRMVVEEGTGTWCGWCVRGYVGMEQMAEKYGDSFICIAVHDDEEMGDAENYYPIFNYISGFPSSIVNRKGDEVDPTFANMEALYKKQKDNAMADIQAKAYVCDDNDNEILVHTVTEFGMSTSNPFRIAFAVVEDGVGPYAQANYYAGGSMGVMGGFETKGSYVPLTYNDVARGIYDFNGVEGSVPATLTMGQRYDYEYRLQLPANVQHRENVKIVALLINQTNGEIVNASRCIPTAMPVGLSAPTESVPHQTAVYSTQGIRLDRSQRGINLIRMSDGSVRKQVVR